MIRILFQGDSITDGNRYKDPESRWDLNHQIGHSYVFSVVGELGLKNPGKYAFINRGLSGDSIKSIPARWERDTLEENPDVLSILLGINGNGNFDGKYPEGVDEHLRLFEEGYRNILNSAREKNPELKLIIIEPFALPVRTLKEHYDDFLPIFRKKQEIIRTIAEDYNAVFVPIQEGLEQLVKEYTAEIVKNGWPNDPLEYWMWDGIHPTEPMHRYIADRWLEATADLLKNI